MGSGLFKRTCISFPGTQRKRQQGWPPFLRWMTWHFRGNIIGATGTTHLLNVHEVYLAVRHGTPSVGTGKPTPSRLPSAPCALYPSPPHIHQAGIPLLIPDSTSITIPNKTHPPSSQPSVQGQALKTNHHNALFLFPCGLWMDYSVTDRNVVMGSYCWVSQVGLII